MKKRNVYALQYSIFGMFQFHEKHADHINTGRYGEAVAARFLMKQGHIILSKNYRKKFGEIDIVSRDTHSCVHFTEVKSVSHETIQKLQQAVLRGTWQPEELVHAFKRRQIKKAIHAWLHETGWNGDTQVNVAVVRLVFSEKYATVKLIPHILL